jgi:hypothetical protein
MVSLNVKIELVIISSDFLKCRGFGHGISIFIEIVPETLNGTDH